MWFVTSWSFTEGARHQLQPLTHGLTHLSDVCNVDWLMGPLLPDPADQPVHNVHNVVVVASAQWLQD